MGLSKYLSDGFNIGNPPTEAIETKKKNKTINIKKPPIEYMSFDLNFIGENLFLFNKKKGIIHPIKKDINAIIRLIVKESLTGFMDNNKNTVKTTKTINGLNK